MLAGHTSEFRSDFLAATGALDAMETTASSQLAAGVLPDDEILAPLAGQPLDGVDTSVFARLARQAATTG